MINLQEFLEKYYLPDEPIILACSTGPDSMFLLYELLKTSFKNQIIACYFNHKIRPEADEEETFLENLWKKLWFQVEIGSGDIKKIRDNLYPSISLEELARQKRYLFFWAICEIYNTKKIMTAHHLDDKIETFFFHLCRGSKLTGLINMTENYGNILRPLLSVEKSKILNYLNTHNLEYRIDSTNFDNDITRNRLRNNIIPEFHHINSQFKHHIKNTLEYFEDVKKHIDQEVSLFLGNTNSFSISAFHTQSDFLQKEILRFIFFITNGNSTLWLSESNIEEMRKFIKWKNNHTKKDIKNLHMKKINDTIFYTSENLKNL